VSAGGENVIGQLCAELRGLLEAELAAGNGIAGAGRGLHGRDAVMVLLNGPFRAKPLALPAGVEWRAVNDPHWWKEEYFHVPTAQCLAGGH